MRFLFLWLLRCFNSPGWLSFEYGGFASVGCPIRTSRDHRFGAAPPRFSQLSTSFIASDSLTIHPTPFYYLNIVMLVCSTILSLSKTLCPAHPHEHSSSKRIGTVMRTESTPARCVSRASAGGRDRVDGGSAIRGPKGNGEVGERREREKERERESTASEQWGRLQGMVEVRRFELLTSCLQSTCSTN
jgi:hypothetical protein